MLTDQHELIFAGKALDQTLYWGFAFDLLYQLIRLAVHVASLPIDLSFLLIWIFQAVIPVAIVMNCLIFFYGKREKDGQSYMPSHRVKILWVTRKLAITGFFCLGAMFGELVTLAVQLGFEKLTEP